MDKTTEQLARYATEIRYQDLTPAAVRATQKLLLATLGCAVGGVRGGPARITRRRAGRRRREPAARVIGTGART